MKKSVLKEYARLIVRQGANVQKGQEVTIYADLDQPEFVKLVVEEAYIRYNEWCLLYSNTALWVITWQCFLYTFC